MFSMLFIGQSAVVDLFRGCGHEIVNFILYSSMLGVGMLLFVFPAEYVFKILDIN